LHQSASQAFQLVAPRALRIVSDAEIAAQRRHQPERQVHRVSEFVGQPQPAKDHPIQGRINRIGHHDSQQRNRQQANQLRCRKRHLLG
jgi:hypothetical protein